METMGIVEHLSKIYSGKKVLITGHTGFKGSWLLLILNRLGAKIYGISLTPDSGDLYSSIQGDKYCASDIFDICDKDVLQKRILEIEPDFVFHLAAQSLVLKSYEDPVKTFLTNGMGTVNLLEGLRQLDRQCTTIVVTTDKVYENLEHGIPFKEDDKLGGYDPYSASKACAEIITTSFVRSFFGQEKDEWKKKYVGTARAGNVIGGGDMSSNRLIPDIIKAIVNNRPIEIRNPDAVRPWQHVVEVLTGYLLLGVYLKNSRISEPTSWNFGPMGDEIMTVQEIAKKSIEKWSYKNIAFDIYKAKSKHHEHQLLKLDSELVFKKLNWKLLMPVGEALDWTIDWYFEVISNKKSAIELTNEQINRYFEICNRHYQF